MMAMLVDLYGIPAKQPNLKKITELRIVTPFHHNKCPPALPCTIIPYVQDDFFPLRHTLSPSFLALTYPTLLPTSTLPYYGIIHYQQCMQ